MALFRNWLYKKGLEKLEKIWRKILKNKNLKMNTKN